MTIEFHKTKEYKRLATYFRKYVPLQGNAKTTGGEIVSALMAIVNSYFNDNEKVNAKKKCRANAALRFIISEVGNSTLSDFVKAETCHFCFNSDIKLLRSRDYEAWLVSFVGFLLDVLDNNQDWFKYELVPGFGWRSFPE